MTDSMLRSAGSTEIIDVTEQTFADVVLGSDLPVLVDFWTTWCGPCRRLAPILTEIAADHVGRLRVVKIDGDAEPALAQACQVRGFPTLQLYQRGELVRSVTGAWPKARIVAELEAVL